MVKTKFGIFARAPLASISLTYNFVQSKQAFVKSLLKIPDGCRITPLKQGQRRKGRSGSYEKWNAFHYFIALRCRIEEMALLRAKWNSKTVLKATLAYITMAEGMAGSRLSLRQQGLFR